MLMHMESNMHAASSLAPSRPTAHVADCCSGALPDADACAAYAANGWILIKGALRPDCATALRAEVLDVITSRNLADSYLAQAQEYLTGGYLDRWVNSPGLQAIAATLLTGAAHRYMQFTAVKGPQQGPFGFHQDNNYTQLRAPGEFRWGLNCWLALDSMRVANGALRVVPGTHRSGVAHWRDSTMNTGHREVAADPTAWTDVIMEPGDLCIFDRNTVHGSGANRTTAPRVAYAVQFHRADTEAFFDDRWELLTTRPRYATRPVDQLSDQAQRTE